MDLLKEKKFLQIIIALALVVPFEVLSLFRIHLSPWIELPLFLTLLVIFGKDVFMNGLKSLVKLDFSDINLLMSISIFGAIYLREFEEAVIIVILFALGNALEDFGMERSQTALTELVNKVPQTAQVKSKAEKTEIEKINIGDIVVVRPGEYIPLDGVVTEGDSLIDESTITGEPLPKNKHANDKVYSGTINGQGYLEIKVTSEAKNSTLAKIVKITSESALKKSQSQKFIEIFATYYTPSVLIIAILLTVIPVFFLGGDFNKWITESITLLLISCPCALVISTPVTIFSAVGNASKKGALIKGGLFLEEMGKLKMIAFDKTRTLTNGTIIVSDIVPFNGVSEKELLSCISGMELLSEHPVAQSIVNKAKEEHLTAHKFVNFQAILGKGVKGECAICIDKHHCMGTLKFITEEHKVGKEVLKQVEEFEKQGKTTIVISDEKKVTGVIAVTDQIRKESKGVIEELTSIGVKSTMLTGDNKSTAQYVAHELGIQNVRPELLPDEKVKEVATLLSEYKNVAMVGDGINDAPALATASVGVAMAAMGSDVAIENADIALMNNDLTLMPFLVRLGRTSKKTIQFNVGMALVIKAIFLSLALMGMSNLVMAILADVGVTVAVVLNSLRLYSFETN